MHVWMANFCCLKQPQPLYISRGWVGLKHNSHTLVLHGLPLDHPCRENTLSIKKGVNYKHSPMVWRFNKNSM